MQELPGQDAPPSLLDALLEYACRGLAAQHVTFCRYEPATHTVRIVAWYGSLAHPELTDTEIALPVYGGDVEALSATLRSDEVLIASLDDRDGTDTAMREFLERVGSHTILFVPVLDIADGIWVLEAFFTSAGRVVGAVERAEASRLARLAAAAIDRHLLVEQNERLLAETRRAQVLHRSLIDHVPAITYVHLRDGTPLHISPQIEQVTGIAAADWEVGLVSWPDALHPDDRERADAAYLTFMEEGGSYSDTYRLLHRDGSVHWMEDRAIMLPGENGGQDVVQGVAVEVTASKEAERALRDSEARYRSLAENNVAGVWQMEGLDVIYVNPAYCRILGIQPEEAMGRGWERFIAEDSRGALAAQQQRVRDDGVAATYELGLVRKDGDRRTTIVSAVPLRSDDGVVTGAIGTLVDVTDLRRAQEALRESEQRRRWVLGELLHAEQEERSRIAAELHDDTVQVMTATLFSLDRVARSVEGDAVVPVTAARELLAAATERTRRLMFELRPPLLEAGGLEPALSELAGQLRRETGLEVTVRLQVGRHPQPVELLVYRVVQEAVANCRKHAAARHVLIELREHDEAINGEIADDGIGFDAEQALDRSRMRLHLGLDAMRERVLLAGGEFGLETSPGQGTAVRFNIPLPRRNLHAVV